MYGGSVWMRMWTIHDFGFVEFRELRCDQSERGLVYEFECGDVLVDRNGFAGGPPIVKYSI